MKPKVSVLLPAYNHQKYIGATVESLFGQKEGNIEILAVDDGSTDCTGEILDAYAAQDHRLKVFHKKNGGVVSALNFALERANGTWIATCGSDDIVPKNAYSALLKAGKNKDVIIGEFFEFDDTGVKTNVRLRHKAGNSDFEMLFAMPATWNKLVRTELLRVNGISFLGVPICEDLIFLAEIAVLKPRCQFIRKPVYAYRNNASSAASMSHSYSLKMFQAHLDGRTEVERICTQGNIAQGSRYVYQASLPFLANYLQHLNGYEQVAAVGAFRRFALRGEPKIDQVQFECLFGVKWEEFCNISDEDYTQRIRHTTHEEWVLRKYRAGEIGLSFLVKCFENWLANRGERRG